MLVSFFIPNTFVIWVDYSSHPDCIGVFEVDFDPTTQTLHLEDGVVHIENMPPSPESPQEKHTRITQSIISANSLDWFDLEGEIFSDFEIGEIIKARVFGGNPHAQIALQEKTISMIISWIQNEELIAEVRDTQTKINTVRTIFNLWNI